MSPSTLQGVTVNSLPDIHHSDRLRFKKSFLLFVIMSQVLHPIEHKIIKTLRDMPNLTYEELAKNSQLEMDQIRRGLEWLKYKNLVEVHQSEINFVSLGSNGKMAMGEGLPERKLVNYLSKHKVCTIEEARTTLPESEFNVAIANARQNGWIEIKKGQNSNIIRSEERRVGKECRL